jgi:hypothetical protein
VYIQITPFQQAREKVFTAFSPKATRRLAKSNMWVDIDMLYTFWSVVVLTSLDDSLIFTDDSPFLWKPEPMNFGTLRTIPPTIETKPPFVSVSIPSMHPKPVFRPHRWVSSHEAATVPSLAFHNMGDHENGTYQYRHEPLMPMNEADWGNMTRGSRNRVQLPVYLCCALDRTSQVQCLMTIT